MGGGEGGGGGGGGSGPLRLIFGHFHHYAEEPSLTCCNFPACINVGKRVGRDVTGAYPQSEKWIKSETNRNAKNLKKKPTQLIKREEIEGSTVLPPLAGRPLSLLPLLSSRPVLPPSSPCLPPGSLLTIKGAGVTSQTPPGVNPPRRRPLTVNESNVETCAQ